MQVTIEHYIFPEQEIISCVTTVTSSVMAA